MAEEYESRPPSFNEFEERPQSFVKRNISEPINDVIDLFRNRYSDSLLSGAFELPLPEGYDVLGSGPATEKNRTLQFYEQTLRYFEFALPHSANWVVFIRMKDPEYVKNEIRAFGKRYEVVNESKDWNFGDSLDTLTNDISQETIGCIFALGVTEPSDGFGTEMAGGVNGLSAGFLKDPVSAGRSQTSEFQMVFKDTNSSYVDFFLRPWSIIASQKGLHARPKGQSIKADITLFSMSYSETKQQSVVRKMVNYYDCVPTGIDGVQNDYDPDKLIQRTVGFTFGRYSVSGGFSLEDVDDAPIEQTFGKTPIEIINEK